MSHDRGCSCGAEKGEPCYPHCISKKKPFNPATWSEPMPKFGPGDKVLIREASVLLQVWTVDRCVRIVEQPDAAGYAMDKAVVRYEYDLSYSASGADALRPEDRHAKVVRHSVREDMLVAGTRSEQVDRVVSGLRPAPGDTVEYIGDDPLWKGRRFVVDKTASGEVICKVETGSWSGGGFVSFMEKNVRVVALADEGTRVVDYNPNNPPPSMAMIAAMPPVSQHYPFLDHLDALAAEDVAGIRKATVSYGDSWKKRGGVSAWMMLARKFDRLEQALQMPNEQYRSIFTAAEEDTRSEGIIDDIRDLRRYLLLVEAELRARGAKSALSTHRDNA